MANTIIIHSDRFRASNGAYGNTIELDLSTYLPKHRHISQIRFREAVVPKITYNIFGSDIILETGSIYAVDPDVDAPTIRDEYRNSQITVRIGSTDYTIVLASGFYPYDRLLAELQNAFNSTDAYVTSDKLSDNNYVISFTADTASFTTIIKITDVNGDNIDFTISCDSIDKQVPTILDLLGFNSNSISTPTPVDTSTSNVIISESPINAEIDRLYYITVDEVMGLKSGYDVVEPKKTWEDGIISILNPAGVGYGDFMHIQLQEQSSWKDISNPSDDDIKKITIRLSRDGFPIFGPMHNKWSAILDIL